MLFENGTGGQSMTPWQETCSEFVFDGELRICILMSDVINGQFNEGLKLLLGTGGKGS